ncbi:ATP-dependent endonuclease [Arsenophonus nasoniae]|uniref:ATP-dependent endonuclease n=2 Tax=Arsenophonus nasoniae TaxID=638 RepID=A0AA95GPU2_9GAMM|nr:ATP-dependent endonuclease [Arsenophonus nasoniae]WGM02608.1 ATP-dependent endonuclease [Arsenophonus nasoniae]
MYLQQVEISGFRGINRLSLTLDHNTVLIGENTWGKSSLLDALTILLSPRQPLYQFNQHDFHHLVATDEQINNLQIILVFCENQPNNHKVSRFKHLLPLWIKGDDEYKRIYYRVSAEQQNNIVATERCFLDKQGNKLVLNDNNKYIQQIIRLYPVLRLRDARFLHPTATTLYATDYKKLAVKFANQLQQLAQALMQASRKLSHKEAEEGFVVLQQLLGYYFAEQNTHLSHRQDQSNIAYSLPNRRGWRVLEDINRIVAKPEQQHIKLIIWQIFSSFLQLQGDLQLARYARPILIIEDPETRLHPIMLSIAWRLLNLFPLQRISSTNSGELLSQVPLKNVCRLVRNSNRVAAFRLKTSKLSLEDMRRLSFHIRFNRPSALFARCWLLVEGETEIWLMNELARQCNYHFESEGVKVIEFAQCGIKPLLKFANSMGIEGHTLVDGDNAGRQYAGSVIAYAEKNKDTARDRLTMLPALDMEHFLYREGFRDIYHQIAGIPDDGKVLPRRVIIKAIHRISKPDLAIEVANRAAEKGINSIPSLLRNMFSRVAWLARGKS